jgi:hypothetical protein
VRGVDMLTLDSGFPVEELRANLDACLALAAPSAEQTVEAVTRRGRRVHCTVSITPLLTDGSSSGAIVIMGAEEIA